VPDYSTAIGKMIIPYQYFLILTESEEDIFIVRSMCQIFVKTVKKMLAR